MHFLDLQHDFLKTQVMYFILIGNNWLSFAYFLRTKKEESLATQHIMSVDLISRSQTIIFAWPLQQ